MSQQDTLLPQELVDTNLQAVLRASGSSLNYYSMQKTKDDMRAAMRGAMFAGYHAIKRGPVSIETYGLSPAAAEDAVHDRLIELGWLPPGTVATRIAELERVQGVLVGALETYMREYNEHWQNGMPILEPIGDAALAAVQKPANPAGVTDSQMLDWVIGRLHVSKRLPTQDVWEIVSFAAEHWDCDKGGPHNMREIIASAMPNNTERYTAAQQPEGGDRG